MKWIFLRQLKTPLVSFTYSKIATMRWCIVWSCDEWISSVREVAFTILHFLARCNSTYMYMYVAEKSLTVAKYITRIRFPSDFIHTKRCLSSCDHFFESEVKTNGAWKSQIKKPFQQMSIVTALYFSSNTSRFHCSCAAALKAKWQRCRALLFSVEEVSEETPLKDRTKLL